MRANHIYRIHPAKYILLFGILNAIYINGESVRQNGRVARQTISQSSHLLNRMIDRVGDGENIMMNEVELTCVENEKRPENQAACSGQPFGFLISYPGDCTKFLVCDCEYPTVKDCPAGLWFNNLTKNCDWPQNVECDTGAGVSTTTTTVVPTTFPPTTTEITTMTNTIETTAWPTDSTTTVDTTVVTDSTTIPTTTMPPEETTTWLTTTTENANNSACKLSSSTPAPPVGISHELCYDQPDGQLYRYPYNCNAYINCTNNCAVLEFCPPGKVFNSILLICDLPDVAFCVEEPLTTTPIPTSTPTTPTPTSTQTTPPNCEPILGIDDNICISNSNKNNTFLPYPYNCKAYLSCENDCAKLQFCKLGTVFNPNLEICDTPDAIECNEQPYPTTTTTTTTTMTTPTLPPDVEPTICLNQPDNSLLPYAGDCSKFILCTKQNASLQSCPLGMLFNPRLLICDDPAEVVCHVTPPITTITPPYTTIIPTSPMTSTTSAWTTITTTPTTATESTTPIYESCLNAPPNSSFPYPADCQKYYFCWGNGTSSLLSCPLDNWYNPVTGDCGPEVSPTACRDYSSTSTTAITPTTTTQTPEQLCQNSPMGSTYPIRDNCQAYIYCVGTGYVILNCPTGNYYNPQTGNCGPDVSPTACRDFNQHQYSPLSHPQLLNAIEVGDEQMDEKVRINLCSDSITPGYHVVPIYDNCSRFLICMGNDVRIMECLNGDHFDPNIGNCNKYASANACRFPASTAAIIDTTPSEPIYDMPLICQSHGSGSKLEYPGNCSKFIVCAYPAPLGYACESGLYFDLEQQRCVNANESSCVNGNSTTTTPASTTTELPTIPGNPCLGQKPGDILPYPPNCKLYIVCLSENSYVISECNTGEYYDPYYGYCTNTTAENACRVGNTTAMPSTTTPIAPTTTIAPPYSNGVCTSYPPLYRLPYPGVCAKYIECESPIPVAYYCENELEFSETFQRCVEPHLANCSIPYTTTTSTTITTTSSGSTDSSSTTSSSSSTISTPSGTSPIPPLSPCENALDGQTFPYTPNCSMYILCLGGEELILQCFPGTYYNIETGNCKSQTSETACRDPVTTSTSTSTSNPIETTTPELTTTDRPPNNAGICDNQIDGALIPYPGNCSKYIICREPIPVAYDCPTGEQFDAITLQCLDKELATCGDYPLTTTTITTTIEDTTTEKTPLNRCMGLENGVILSYWADCAKYIVCLNNEEVLVNCMPGSYFDPNLNRCSSNASETTCQQVENTTSTASTNMTTLPTTALPIIGNVCCDLAVGTLLPYPNDDSRFIECQYPIPIVFVCDDHTQFDPERLKCLPPPTLPPNNDDGPNIPIRIESDACMHKASGTIILYPGDCTHYQFCFGGVAYLLKCEHNWNFNPRSGQCVPPSIYHCPW